MKTPAQQRVADHDMIFALLQFTERFERLMTACDAGEAAEAAAFAIRRVRESGLFARVLKGAPQ